MNSKYLGATLIVAGTVIGAGMLGIPLATSSIGFGATLAELVAFYILMIIPALAIAELCQFAPPGTSMAGLCKLAFGKFGYWLNNIAFLLLAYAMLSAYISGTYENVYRLILGDNPSYAANISLNVVIGLVFSVMIVFSQRTADIINQVVFYILLLAFVLMVVVGSKYLHLSYLVAPPKGFSDILTSIPVLFLAYGFQLIIPTLFEYLEHDVRLLKASIWSGLSIPFAILVLWCLVVHGNAPQEALSANGGNVNISKFLFDHTHSDALQVSVKVFSVAALITSFIGVGLALVTTLKNLFLDTNAQASQLLEKESKEVELNNEVDINPETVSSVGNIKSRLKTWHVFLLVFILPILVITVYPQFLGILNFASVLFTLQCITIPMLALYVLRKKDPKFYTRNKNVYRFCLPTNAVLVLAIVLFIFSTFGLFL